MSETSGNVNLFIFSSWLVSFGVSIYIQYSFDVEINSKQCIPTKVSQKNIKSSRKEYVMWTYFNFWLMKKIFQKLYANNSFIVSCLTV